MRTGVTDDHIRRTASERGVALTPGLLKDIRGMEFAVLAVLA